MRHIARLSAAAGLAAGLAAPAAAQDLAVWAGVALTSNYVSSGVTNSADKPAVQPYVELSFGGAYAGIWASNVDFGGPDDLEVDLYLGYRGEAGALSYDIGYARYYYDATGDCCGEFTLGLSLAASDQVSLESNLSWDPEASTGSAEIGGSYAFNDTFTGSTLFGYGQGGTGTYGDIGVTAALSDATALDLRWHDSSEGPGILALTLSFDVQILGQ